MTTHSDAPATRPVRVRAACYAALGALLLVLNLAGLVAPLRNDAIYADPANGFVGDITLPHEDFRRESPRRPGEADAAYIARLTGLVNRGMAHQWVEPDPATYNLRVPATENYLLALAAVARPGVYGRHEFADPDRAMARGVGWCSQHALVVAALLERAGIAARIAALAGHVVVEAVAGDGARYIADADFGVVMPRALAEIEADPELARPYYEAAALAWRGHAGVADLLVAAYGPEGNRLVAADDWHLADADVFEAWAYRLKWPVPLALLALAALVWHRRPSSADPVHREPGVRPVRHGVDAAPARLESA